MKDFIIAAVLSIVASIVIDVFWFNSKHWNAIRQELGFYAGRALQR